MYGELREKGWVVDEWIQSLISTENIIPSQIFAFVYRFSRALYRNPSRPPSMSHFFCRLTSPTVTQHIFCRVHQVRQFVCLRSQVGPFNLRLGVSRYWKADTEVSVRLRWLQKFCSPPSGLSFRLPSLMDPFPTAVRGESGGVRQSTLSPVVFRMHTDPWTDSRPSVQLDRQREGSETRELRGSGSQVAVDSSGQGVLRTLAIVPSFYKGGGGSGEAASRPQGFQTTADDLSPT